MNFEEGILCKEGEEEEMNIVTSKMARILLKGKKGTKNFNLNENSLLSPMTI